MFVAIHPQSLLFVLFGSFKHHPQVLEMMVVYLVKWFVSGVHSSQDLTVSGAGIPLSYKEVISGYLGGIPHWLVCFGVTQFENESSNYLKEKTVKMFSCESTRSLFNSRHVFFPPGSSSKKKTSQLSSPRLFFESNAGNAYVTYVQQTNAVV